MELFTRWRCESLILNGSATGPSKSLIEQLAFLSQLTMTETWLRGFKISDGLVPKVIFFLVLFGLHR